VTTGGNKALRPTCVGVLGVSLRLETFLEPFKSIRIVPVRSRSDASGVCPKVGYVISFACAGTAYHPAILSPDPISDLRSDSNIG
jgi:hypothetical protein